MSRPTRGPCIPVSRTGLSPAMARLSRRFRYQKHRPLAWSAFARHYSTESRLMSFPPATEMFQFAGFASSTLWIQIEDTACGWVAPFGDPGINDRSHLPRAFRSVPRPSSPLSAKASTRCPYFALERHTQRQGPLQIQPPRTGGKHPRTTQMRQTLLSEDTSRIPGTAQASQSRRTRSPATVTQLASLRLSISKCPGCPPRSHGKLSLHPSISTRPGRLATVSLRFSERRGAPTVGASPRQSRRWRLAGGGGERDRTDDLLLAKQVLSQLSYTPVAQKPARQAIRDRQRRPDRPTRSAAILTAL